MVIIDWNIKTDPLKIWGYRRDPFKDALLVEKPDIFCAQEAQKHQVDFFVEFLDEYQYIGRGRDDGKEKGEYNPIFYNTKTLNLVDNDMFWLTNTPHAPSKAWDPYPRICTWGKFEEKSSGKRFYVFNTHMPLPYNIWGKHKALRVVEAIIKNSEDIPKILTGDFNSRASGRLWKRIYHMGFQKNPNTNVTHKIFAIPLFCFDGIFTTPHFYIKEYRILKNHRGAIYPSDHFGVLAEVELKS